MSEVKTITKDEFFKNLDKMKPKDITKDGESKNDGNFKYQIGTLIGIIGVIMIGIYIYKKNVIKFKKIKDEDMETDEHELNDKDIIDMDAIDKDISSETMS